MGSEVIEEVIVFQIMLINFLFNVISICDSVLIYLVAITLINSCQVSRTLVGNRVLTLNTFLQFSYDKIKLISGIHGEVNK